MKKVTPPAPSLRRLRVAALALLLAFTCFATSARADIAYTANAAGGTFAPDAHYMQQITLAGPDVPFTINFFTAFGVRWNDITQGTQFLRLTFWTNVNTDPAATNVLAGASNHGSITYSLAAPGANGSYNYTLSSAGNPINIMVPGPTFALEITMLNSTQTGYSTAIGARYSTDGAPTVGTALNFVWADNSIGNSDGIFAGSERRNPSGAAGQTHQNIRMSIDATAVPEPATNAMLLMGAGVGALVLLQRRRRLRS